MIEAAEELYFVAVLPLLLLHFLSLFSSLIFFVAFHSHCYTLYSLLSLFTFTSLFFDDCQVD